MNEILTKESLKKYLPDSRLGLITVYDTIDSTNMELERRINGDIQNGTIVMANEQTLGKGRNGRTFDSPAGSGIYLSYLFKPGGKLQQEIAKNKSSIIWASLTSWTAVAVSSAIERVCGIRPGIKWVNDLYINGKKICGILTQLKTGGRNMDEFHIIIGIGINVNEQYVDFPSEYRPLAGSLLTETRKEVSRTMLSAYMVGELDKMIEAWPREKSRFYKAYTENSLVIGKKVRLKKGEDFEEALAIGIDEDFALLILDSRGNERKVLSGDVTLRL